MPSPNNSTTHVTSVLLIVTYGLLNDIPIGAGNMSNLQLAEFGFWCLPFC